jgi:hypothetical protein
MLEDGKAGAWLHRKIADFKKRRPLKRFRAVDQ